MSTSAMMCAIYQQIFHYISARRTLLQLPTHPSNRKDGQVYSKNVIAEELAGDEFVPLRSLSWQPS